MPGPRGTCTIVSRNITSFKIFITINLGYKITTTTSNSKIRCGVDISTPPTIVTSGEFAFAFQAQINMKLNDAGTAFEPLPADITNYDTAFDNKVLQLTNAVAAQNAVITTIQDRTSSVTCVPADRRNCTPAVMGNSTVKITKQTVKEVVIRGTRVFTSGGAICTFN